MTIGHFLWNSQIVRPNPRVQPTTWTLRSAAADANR